MKEEIDAVNYVELMLPIYDRLLSDAEVNDLVAFYESPLGRKVIGVMPVIIDQARIAGEERGKLAGQRAFERLLAEGYKPDGTPPQSTETPPGKGDKPEELNLHREQ